MWSFAPGAVVWRILFGQTNRIVGESRDNDRKKVTFFCLDGRSGRSLWTERSTEEPWWVGLETVQKNVVLLHGFQEPDLPGHFGIYAWDVESGEELWRNDKTTFWFCYRDRVYAYRTLFERRIGYALDLETGDVLETYDEGIEDLFKLRELARKEVPEDTVEFPEKMSGTAPPPEAQSLIERETKNKRIVGGIEYLFQNPYLIMNYHVPGRNSALESLKLENHLAIFDSRRRRKVFGDILALEASAPVPDSFFLRNSVVFFVKEQRKLLAVALPESS